MLKRFFTNESGATGIEYALIAAFLSVAISPVIATLGPKLFLTYDSVAKVM
ncbi:MAG: Flp family type IVb pilin [Hyphomicrobiales bacterium]